MNYANPRTAQFRATLDRLPDEIALAIGLRVFDEAALNSRETCVCGWAVREAIAREANLDPDNVQRKDFEDSPIADTTRIMVERFGGDTWGWTEIFSGVTSHEWAPLIEEALFDRVMAAATAPTAKRPSPSKTSKPAPHKRGRGQ